MLLNDDIHGGIGVLNYEEVRDALLDMFVHMRSLADALGVSLDIMFPEQN